MQHVDCRSIDSLRFPPLVPVDLRDAFARDTVVTGSSTTATSNVASPRFNANTAPSVAIVDDDAVAAAAAAAF